MQPQSDSGLTEDFVITISALTQANSPGIVYVSFTRDIPEECAVASFQCILKFVSKEIDPTSGQPEEEGYEDEYQLEEVELAAGGDYIVPSYSSFAAEWERLRTAATATETFALSAMESLKGMHFLLVWFYWILTILVSRLRLYYRDPQHGTTWWIGTSYVDICAHIAAIGPSDRWWREGTRAVSDDIFDQRWCDTRTGCSCRETGGMQSCDCGHWRVMDCSGLFFFCR